jgi:hypothetical protein
MAISTKVGATKNLKTFRNCKSHRFVCSIDQSVRMAVRALDPAGSIALDRSAFGKGANEINRGLPG